MYRDFAHFVIHVVVCIVFWYFTIQGVDIDLRVCVAVDIIAKTVLVLGHVRTCSIFNPH